MLQKMFAFTDKKDPTIVRVGKYIAHKCIPLELALKSRRSEIAGSCERKAAGSITLVTAFNKEYKTVGEICSDKIKEREAMGSDLEFRNNRVPFLRCPIIFILLPILRIINNIFPYAV
jgi:hypothetical protein